VDSEAYTADKTEHITGMGVYNSANLQFEGVDLDARRLLETELREEFETGDLPQEDKQSAEYREAEKSFKA